MHIFIAQSDIIAWSFFIKILISTAVFIIYSDVQLMGLTFLTKTDDFTIGEFY